MREFGLELGLDRVEYAGSFQTTSVYLIGMYRLQYLDAQDFSVGGGGGIRQAELGSRKESEPFIKLRGMSELDLSPNQTLSFILEYNRDLRKGFLNENLQDFLILASYTYYFGFYNLGE